MLTDYEDLWEAVQSDMNVTDEAPLYPLATVKSAVNRAYIKCAGLFRWPGTEGAKRTTTQLNQEYYDYPSDFRDDSIWRLEVNGDQYGEGDDGSPMAFDDYLIWRADDSNIDSTEKKWANHERRFFIYPVPTSAGLTIDVWGQQVVTGLVNPTDVTIFSYSTPECNEAIVLEAEAILKSKGEEEKSGEFRSTEAKQILITAWNKVRQEQPKYEKSSPFFQVEDMFD
jgi:hypothetical protein